MNNRQGTRKTFQYLREIYELTVRLFNLPLLNHSILQTYIFKLALTTLYFISLSLYFQFILNKKYT